MIDLKTFPTPFSVSAVVLLVFASTSLRAQAPPLQPAPLAEADEDQSGAAAPGQQPQPVGSQPGSKHSGGLTIGEKFGYFEKPAFGPRGLLMTAAGVGLSMANPTGAYNNYPHEWLHGAGAFGRNYGDQFARNEASAFGRFVFDSSLHIDPRYSRSNGKGLLGRSAHALVFTFIGKTDGGNNIPAVGNFAGAAGSGFVGSAYMPNGWNDTTHAGQRALITFGGYAAHNLFQEFAPEIGRALQRIHIRKLVLLPIWWTR